MASPVEPAGPGLESILDQLQLSWQSGVLPPLEQLLAGFPGPCRPAMLAEILRLERDYVLRQGKPYTRAEVLPRVASLGTWVEEVLGSLFDSAAPVLSLNVIEGAHVGRSAMLTGHATCMVGRGPAAVGLALEADPGVSGQHFLVEFNPPMARLSDLRSKNGTFLNGAKVTTPTNLKTGDIIGVGTGTRIRVVMPTHTTVSVPQESEATATEPGTDLFIPGYDLLGELGRGGMGVVYKARRCSDGQIVAIKTVLPATAPNAESLQRFKREMALLQSLDHPHIVRFLEAGESGCLLYFVMEFVEGSSTSSLIAQHGPFPLARVIDVGVQLLEALAHAHLQGIVHRDIKPGNLLLIQEQGRDIVKLADFGLGRAYQASAMSGLTVAGVPGGTPAFMPPEQMTDFRSARPAADQYGAAATLYYLLTGQMIYERCPTHADLYRCIAQNEPIPLRQPSPGPALPGSVVSVLGRALAREPRRRYLDVLAFRDALRGCLTQP